jgi:hypothetical protein
VAGVVGATVAGVVGAAVVGAAVVGAAVVGAAVVGAAVVTGGLVLAVVDGDLVAVLLEQPTVPTITAASNPARSLDLM